MAPNAGNPVGAAAGLVVCVVVATAYDLLSNCSFAPVATLFEDAVLLYTGCEGSAMGLGFAVTFVPAALTYGLVSMAFSRFSYFHS